ncbi:MAG: pentapeptide repeat-containing protein, partial [Advenella sp.]
HQTLWPESCLADCNFSRALLDMSVFHQANCENANFSQSDLSFSDFTGANLSGILWIQTTFSRTRLHRALVTDVSLKKQPGVIEKDPEFFEAELFSAHLQSGANWS